MQKWMKARQVGGLCEIRQAPTEIPDGGQHLPEAVLTGASNQTI